MGWPARAGHPGRSDKPHRQARGFEPRGGTRPPIGGGLGERHVMIFLGFFQRSVSEPPAPMVHIHQGGTANTYCGEPLRLDALVTNVSWEQAEEATCFGCHAAFFPTQWAAAEQDARAERFHTFGSTR